MLSIDICKKILDEPALTDKEVEEIRNNLYCIIENILLINSNN